MKYARYLESRIGKVKFSVIICQNLSVWFYTALVKIMLIDFVRGSVCTDSIRSLFIEVRDEIRLDCRVA